MPATKKVILVTPLVFFYRTFAHFFGAWRRLRAFARVSSKLSLPLPVSTVILGDAQVYGTGRVRFGERLLLYPGQYLETNGQAEITLGNNVVLSTGVHLVAYAGISVGDGSMIGEYTSSRDANHTRDPAKTLRDSGHTAKRIVIGSEVWIGRGVTVLGGVTIGDGATIGANAVVTRDVAPGATVAGVPAAPIHRKSTAPESAGINR
jgi:acetyltransferase-like isoleucine patch superfamily enzyme